MDSPSVVYEQSTVAFIDILGFKEALNNEQKAKDILEALTHVKVKAGKYCSEPLWTHFQGIYDIKIAAFSDSIVISGTECQIFQVLVAATKFCQLLIKKGFLCRGGVACGELYHKDGVLLVMLL